MFTRLVLLMAGLFWLTMTFLLWRSEFGGRSHLGGAVPVQMVWQKILTAPDNSSLEILHHKKKIGFCHWATSMANAGLTQYPDDTETSPEGMVESFTSYRIDFEGNAMLDSLSNRMRFDFGLRLNTNQVWQEVKLQITARAGAWEIASRASEKTVRLRIQDEYGQIVRKIKFEDFANPEKLLRNFGVSPLVLGGLGFSPGKTLSGTSFALPWEASNDWMKIGHSQVRVYRMEARLLDRYRIVVITSRVGEILRVELPDELVLVNDQLVSL